MGPEICLGRERCGWGMRYLVVDSSNVVTKSRLTNLDNGAKNGNHLSCHLSQVVIPSMAERCGIEICKCSSNNYMNVSASTQTISIIHPWYQCNTPSVCHELDFRF